MKVLSLFDGISCGRVALERAGIPVEAYYASEVDSYAVRIALKNYSDTIELGDVRGISYANGRLFCDNDFYDVGGIDLVIGGSPCQSFTFAGKRQGMCTESNESVISLNGYLSYKWDRFSFKGESYLFWEYMRILEEVKPRYFLLENVNMKAQWRDVITEALGVSPVRLNSNLFSAQNRDRLYWTNIPLESVKVKDGRVLRDIVDDKYDLPRYALSKKHMDAFMRSYSWRSNSLDEKSKPLLATYYKQPPHCPYVPSKVSDSGYRRLHPVECERLQTLPDNYTLCGDISDTQRYKCLGNGWTVDTIVHIFRGLNRIDIRGSDSIGKPFVRRKSSVRKNRGDNLGISLFEMFN